MATKTISTVVQELERLAPGGTAEDWDNVGLLVGDPAWKTAGAVVTIDLTAEAIQLAKKKKFKLIVTHHPCIFPKNRGLARVVGGEGRGLGMSSYVFEALREGVAVIACHTNFDQCALEVVESVSTGLGIAPQGRLMDHTQGSLLKLVVYVPEGHTDQVRKALCAAGAGQIGNYDFCTFAMPVEGTFRGNGHPQPYIGVPERLERVSEVRLETVLPRSLRRPVISALLASHPYEEVAYDLYAVEQAPLQKGLVRGLGYGFWGEFNSLRPFSEVVRSVKRLFNVNSYWLTEPAPARIRKIAYVAGKGSAFLDSAVDLGCDLFITGEAGYHPAVESARKGMAVLELGHRESERFFVPTMQSWLKNLDLQIVGLNRVTQKIR